MDSLYNHFNYKSCSLIILCIQVKLHSKESTVKSFIFMGLKFRGFQISDKLEGI